MGGAFGLGGEFDFESGVFDHLFVGIEVLSAGGEVAVGEHGVGGVEGEGLDVAKGGFAAAGDADFDGGHDEAHHGECAEAVVWCEGVGFAVEGGAGAGVEEVDGNGVDV